MAAAIIGAVSIAIWTYLIGFRGQFWRIERAASTAAPVRPRSVVAVIPARDEAPVIGAAVTSLLAQDYAGELRIVVVDDHSSDGTAAAARAAAGALGAGDRVTVVGAAPLPRGWTGKLWAVREGIAVARRGNPDFLLLTDADIVHAANNLRELVARAESGRYDQVSLMVRLHCRSLWERLIVPAFVFFFFKLHPPRWVADPARTTSAAAGGCILLRPAALDRVGGIDSIRHEIIDDCALARRIKAVGRVWLGLSEHTRSVRAYRSWRPLWDMIVRSAFAQLAYSGTLLAATIVGMAFTYLAPPLLLLTGHPLAMALGLAAWLMMSLAFLPILTLYRCSPAWALLLPAIAAFYMAATVHSAILFWSGRGGMWKGRFQAQTAE